MNHQTQLITHFISRFSTQNKGVYIELFDEGKAARMLKSDSYWSSVLLNHSGLHEGVWEWEFVCTRRKMRILGRKACMIVGVSPSGSVGTFPGHSSMPGSIGMDGAEGQVISNGDWHEEGFNYTTGDTIILRLNLTHARTVTWTLKSDPTKTVTKPLPQAGPYVPAVGLFSKGAPVRIGSYRRIE